MRRYVSLQLSLKVVLVIVDDSLVGDGDKNLFPVSVGQVVHSIIDVVVEANCPFEFESARLPVLFFLGVVVFLHC